MTNVYFVRHAHSVYTRDEHERPLSEKGFSDAKKVTTLLKNEEIDIVVSSPYKRAIQTVKGTAQTINKEVEVVDNFKERTLTIVPVENFTQAIKKVWEDEYFAWEGGESNVAAQQRGVEALYHILEKYKGKNIVIGTHGNIMVLIMNFFSKQYDYTFWQNLDMPDIYKLTFDGKELRNVERVWN
ncbi:histidine phosphatase family protein [Alkalihalobacterium bogoriense]|uniref:histidine phosphatase family protein n=1 Tax=Alkalihalobacterium bogoriense TaxID=246272 RepID=UPI00047DDD7D|nr:histidine phosphatase family protein [Alkalihalobacterium bogoriense]